MTEVTINDKMETKSIVMSWNVEVENGKTLTTPFSRIVAVAITEEETTGTSDTIGYSKSGGVITFNSSGTLTCGVIVTGFI
jgi:hypothetical protein